MAILNPLYARLQAPDYSDTLIVKLKSTNRLFKAVEDLRRFGTSLPGLKKHLKGTRLKILKESKLRSLLSGNSLQSITPLFKDAHVRIPALLDEIEGIAKANDVRVQGRLVLRFKTPSGAKSALKALLSDALVEYAHFPAIRYEANGALPDPAFNLQWGLKAIRFFDLLNEHGFPPQIKDEGRIAMIDTGVDTTNPDLDENIVVTRNFSEGKLEDTAGHGTHIAGTIGAETGNAFGIQGICRLSVGAPLVSYKALSPYSAEGYYRALGEVTKEAPKIRVLNLSLSGTDPDRTEKDLIDQAIQHDIAVVAAMGNSGTSVKEYPAALPGVIAVGGHCENGSRLPESSMGAHLLLLAPGKNILSTVPVGGSNFIDGLEDTATMSGTSMAAAFVTATIALMRTIKPALTLADIRDILISSCDLMNGQVSGVHSDEFGYGRLNLKAALEQAAQA